MMEVNAQSAELLELVMISLFLLEYTLEKIETLNPTDPATQQSTALQDLQHLIAEV